MSGKSSDTPPVSAEATSYTLPHLPVPREVAACLLDSLDNAKATPSASDREQLEAMRDGKPGCVYMPWVLRKLMEPYTMVSSR